MKHMALINVSEVPWSKERRRNQAIFQSLIKNKNIFDFGVYINPPKYSDSPFWRYERIKSISSVLSIERTKENVSVVSPDFSLPLSFKKPVTKFLAHKIMKAAIREAGNRRYMLWINNSSYHMYYITKELMKCSNKVIIDLSDDWLTYERKGNVCDESKKRLEYLIGKSDIMIAVNDHVANKYKHKNTIVFNNATDFPTFQKSTDIFRMPNYFPKPAGKIFIGFIGGLHRGRVDEELLFQLFKEFSEYIFIFVGHSNDNLLLEKISAFKNVKFINTVPFDMLPSIIKSFDVAIVPHLINEHTHGNDLLKVLDYMAAGVPVVTTNCSNVKKYENAVFIADNGKQFIKYVREIINGNIPHDPGRGFEFAKSYSWDKTVPELEKLIIERLKNSNKEILTKNF